MKEKEGLREEGFIVVQSCATSSLTLLVSDVNASRQSVDDLRIK